MKINNILAPVVVIINILQGPQVAEAIQFYDDSNAIHSSSSVDSPSTTATSSTTFPTDDICEPENKFQIQLVVLPHLYFLFKPTIEAASNGCNEFLVYSASNPDDDNKNAKVVRQLDSSTSLVSLEADLGFPNHEAVFIPMFYTETLQRIETAYNAASADGKNQEGQPYHYILNNCGDFLTNLLAKLGYTCTPESAAVTAMVLDTILPEEFYTQIRLTAAADSSSGITTDMTNAEIMHRLVHMRLSQIYQQPSSN